MKINVNEPILDCLEPTETLMDRRRENTRRKSELEDYRIEHDCGLMLRRGSNVLYCPECGEMVRMTNRGFHVVVEGRK